MKKFLIFSLMILFSGVAGAQTYPNSLHGAKVANGEETEIQMWMQASNSMEPWGMPDLIGIHYWLGILNFTIRAGVDTAILDLSHITYRYCEEAPWGSVDENEVCYYYSPREINAPPYSLIWNEFAQAYISEQWAYWGASIVVLTVKNPDKGIVKLQFGTMQLEDGEMFWDETRPHYIYKIEPFLAEKRGPVPRRSSRHLSGD